MTNTDSIQESLLDLARDLEPTWGAEICRAAAREIDLLKRIIINDPVELPIEEGDRANG